MKRLSVLFLILCLIFTGCGESAPREPATFYYRRSDTVYGTSDGIITGEVREIAGTNGDLGAILALYLKGPESPGLESPFPRDAAVLEWAMEGDTLTLTMTDSFSAINGVELTIACSCITKTVLALTDVSQVRFQVADGLIGGEKMLTMSADQISLSDDSLDQAWAEFTVYYTDRQMRYLIGQEISVNLATEDDVIACLIEALSNPPENSGLLSTISPGADLLGYSIDDGVCTIDFSGELEYNGWNNAAAQRLTLLSVVNTLTQLEQIHQVEFSVEGNLLVQYRLISITAPLEYDESAIGPVRTGMNEIDAALYLCNSSDVFLTAVPTRLRQTSGMSEAELVVTALLQYPAHNGFYSPVPANTELNSLMIFDGICHLDLSGEFLSQPENLTRAVRSIVSSVCDLEDVFGVKITVDGVTPETAYPELFEILSPRNDWFV